MGNGSSGNPLSVDFGAVASKPESNRIIENEATPLAPSAVVGTTVMEATASGGRIRLGPANSPASGTLWRVEKAQSRSLFGIGSTLVTLRARVGNTQSSSVLAHLRCGAMRNGTSTFTEVAAPVQIIPSNFTAGVWRELELVCNFLPDDIDQFIAVEDFTPGVTDLMLDYVRAAPVMRTVSHYSAGALSCRPLNSLYQPGWTNMLVRASVYVDPNCATPTTNACHVWCASTCLLQNLSDCAPCCGTPTYYTAGVADIMLYR